MHGEGSTVHWLHGSLQVSKKMTVYYALSTMGYAIVIANLARAHDAINSASIPTVINVCRDLDAQTTLLPLRN